MNKRRVVLLEELQV